MFSEKNDPKFTLQFVQVIKNQSNPLKLMYFLSDYFRPLLVTFESVDETRALAF